MPNAGQAPQSGAATVYEGARLIVGDGSAPIEDSAIVVSNGKIRGSRPSRAGDGARQRGPRQPEPEDDHPGDHRHPYAPGDHPRRARRSAAAPGVLRDRRHPQPGNGRRRGAVPGPRRDDSECGALPDGGARHHDAREGPNRSPVLDHDRRRSAEGGAGAGRPQGRHRQDLGRRSQRRLQEDDAGALRRRHRRGAQATTCASPPTSSRSRMRRACCARVSTASPTACATRTSTTSSSRCSSSGRTCS